MRKWILCAAAATLASGAALSQPKAPIDQSKNWETFMKLYPKRALAAGEEGLVAFKLTLDRNGHPTACQVTHSSRHKLLDTETCELLMMHAVFTPPKDAQGNRLAVFRTEGVINWRIPGGDTMLVRPVKVAKLDPLDKKICKRSVRTGTLAGFERTCMTVREWDSQRTEAMDAMANIQGIKGFTGEPKGCPVTGLQITGC
jgi:TonB family protein